MSVPRTLVSVYPARIWRWTHVVTRADRSAVRHGHDDSAPSAVLAVRPSTHRRALRRSNQHAERIPDFAGLQLAVGEIVGYVLVLLMSHVASVLCAFVL